MMLREKSKTNPRVASQSETVGAVYDRPFLKGFGENLQERAVIDRPYKLHQKWSFAVN
jgi:hypothetical protein